MAPKGAEIINTHPRFLQIPWGFPVRSRISAGSEALRATAGQTLGSKSNVSVKGDRKERTM